MIRDRPSTHIDTVMMEAYAAQLLDAGAEASIERHLSRCDKCRADVAAAGARGDLAGLGPDRLGSIWAGVIDELDASPVAVPRGKRHLLPAVGERIRPLLARFAVPPGRLVPWVRLAVVTAVAVITLPALINISGSGSPAGGNIDSMVVSGTKDHARTALHDMTPRPPCSQTEVSFTLTWGLRWLTWVAFTVGYGLASGNDSDPDQQRFPCRVPVFEGLIAAGDDGPDVSTATTRTLVQSMPEAQLDVAQSNHRAPINQPVKIAHSVGDLLLYLDSHHQPVLRRGL